MLNKLKSRRSALLECLQPDALVGNGMNLPSVLLIAAVDEGATAVAILSAPGLVARLLFGSELDGISLSVARIAGMVLFAFALTCEVAARNGELKEITVGILVYNLLVGAYFRFFGAIAPNIGPLLWQAAVFHVVFYSIACPRLARSDLRGHEMKIFQAGAMRLIAAHSNAAQGEDWTHAAIT